jgi:copper chaperone CopZ
MNSVYNVSGMTCGHCVESVTKAMQGLPGVATVSVDLESGQVEITSEAAPSSDAVRAAIEGIGFELVA